MKQIILLALLLTVALSSRFCTKYTSSNTVFNSKPLNDITPAPINCGGLPCESFVWGDYWTKLATAHLTCFGWFGPLSSYGPLSDIGPAILGKNTKYFGDDVQKFIRDSTAGPLSNMGPLGEAFFGTMPHINDFTKHMQGLGLWSVLGPLGPLGPLGHLGPLGPMGIHGLKQAPEGDYQDVHGRIQRTIKSKWEGNTYQAWPLFETYSQERAVELSNNGELDTSFSILNVKNQVKLELNSEGNQYVTIAAVPIVQGGQITIYAHDVNQNPESTNVIAANKYFISWIQVEVPKDTKFGLTVVGGSDMFNLYVVGSTPFMNRKPTTNFHGDYIGTC